MNGAKCLLSFLVLGFLIAGCSKDDNPATPNEGTSSTYVGTVASGNESGSITFDVAPNKSAGTNGAVTGVLTLVAPSGATINLTGTFSNNILAMTGSSYSFNGALSGNSFSGGYTGPNGPGQFSAQSSSNNSVKVFAGTYTSNTISGRHGNFNIVLDGNVITGFTVSSNNESTALSGTLNGNNITLLGGIAVGVLNGTSVSGTYDNGSGDSGVWSGTQIAP
jgi:hypothetical protein